MRTFFRAAALAFLPLPALAAPVCDMRGAEPLEVFETAKAAFLKGDFKSFAQVTTTLVKGGPAAFGEAVGSLEGLFPNGFESCQTVVQRIDVGGMVQEISTFNIKGLKGPMSVYLLALPTRGSLEISYVTFDTTMSKVLNELR
ncbi:hypothetical protein [uncultured Tateyamaria sp.]|uniref:hypothetical protein n=1 Tax=uncultured Tateyamaria sp. TaxID=455651 RepID=UPI002630426A|nr:hypothetical protein [uncultured Tateyamaria sp.]